MTDSAAQARPASLSGTHRPRGRPGRKPKGSVPVVVVETPDQPDLGYVLTWRQRKILRVIRDWVHERGYPPSMREIADAVGLTSTSSVKYQLSVLQRKGYLHRDAGRARTMEVRLPGRRPVRPEGAAAGSAHDEPGGARDEPGGACDEPGSADGEPGSVRDEQRPPALSSRELIAGLARRRAELGLSRVEVARRMKTSQAAVARLEAQLAALARYTEALGL